jgi:hypothetical protein
VPGSPHGQAGPSAHVPALGDPRPAAETDGSPSIHPAAPGAPGRSRRVVLASRRWAGLVVVPRATVRAGQHQRVQDDGARRSRTGWSGVRAIGTEARDLLRRISAAHPRWGAPRILGALGQRGPPGTQSPIETDRVRRRPPASPPERAFGKPRGPALVAREFFPVPTGSVVVRFAVAVRAPARRRVLDVTGTAQPTAPWTAQSLVEACPWATAPTPRVPDRDALSSAWVPRRVPRVDSEAGLAAREPVAPCGREAPDRAAPAGLSGSSSNPERGPPQAHPCRFPPPFLVGGAAPRRTGELSAASAGHARAGRILRQYKGD